MKIAEIEKRYGIDPDEFVRWLHGTDYVFSDDHFGETELGDSQDIDLIVSEFVKSQEAALASSKKKLNALSGMLITSGFSFEGYNITKYSGYISGDDVVQIDRGRAGFFSQVTDVGDALMGSLAEIRRNALAELKEAAFDLGCNAVIGVDFDYLVMDPETVNSNGGTLYLPYVLGVTANGNAVTIKKSGA